MATVSYDRISDVLYIELVPEANLLQTEGEEIGGAVVTLLYDEHDALIGIEITSASKHVLPTALAKVPPA